MAPLRPMAVLALFLTENPATACACIPGALALAKIHGEYLDAGKLENCALGCPRNVVLSRGWAASLIVTLWYIAGADGGGGPMSPTLAWFSLLFPPRVLTLCSAIFPTIESSACLPPHHPSPFPDPPPLSHGWPLWHPSLPNEHTPSSPSPAFRLGTLHWTERPEVDHCSCFPGLPGEDEYPRVGGYEVN